MSKTNLELLHALLKEAQENEIEIGVKNLDMSTDEAKTLLDDENVEVLSINGNDLDEDFISLLDAISGGEFSKMHEAHLKAQQEASDEPEEDNEAYADHIRLLCNDLVDLINRRSETSLADLITAVTTISVGMASDEVDNPDKYIEFIDNLADNIILNLIDQSPKLQIDDASELLSAILHASRKLVNSLEDVAKALQLVQMREAFLKESNNKTQPKVVKKHSESSSSRKVECTEFSYSKFIQ